MDSEDIKKEFELWAGVPRTILKIQEDEAWKPRLQSILNIDQLQKCMKFDGESHDSDIDQVSRKLIHLVSTDDECAKAQVRWVSQELCDYTLISFAIQHVREGKNLILATRFLGEYGSLRGNMFENFAHVIISAGGGEFQVRNLEDNSITSVNFQKLPHYNFRNITDIKAG